MARLSPAERVVNLLLNCDTREMISGCVEGLGTIGRSEGIAVMAVATVEKG